MSLTTTRDSRHAKYQCQSCRQRRDRFRFAGTVRADRQHTLCLECYRALHDRTRARSVGETRSPEGLRSSYVRSLTPRQIEHRRTMLAHLESL